MVRRGASRGRQHTEINFQHKHSQYTEIEEIETAIQTIMDELHSPITTVPGIDYRMGASEAPPET